MSAHNYPAAIEAYRTVAAADTRDPLPLYFLGEAQVAAGELDNAEASFGGALAAVGANDDMHARLLFALAELREQQGKWLDAKRAWEAYGEFASSHPNAKSYATTAAERAKTIGVHLDLETKYAPVKQRAEQRAKDAAPLSSSAPASSVAPAGSARVEASPSGSSSERAPASEGASKKK
jgi:tetratricopeptide (TPR) repeat protein